MPPGRSAALILVLIASGCRRDLPLPTVSRAGPAMGETFSVAVWGSDSGALARAVTQAFDSVHVVDSLLNDTRSWRPTSSPHPVSATVAAVLRLSLDVSRASDGAFDPTGGGYRRVALDTMVGAVALPRGPVLDFRGIAEGYALDRALLPLASIADSAVLALGTQYLVMTPAGGHSGAGRRFGVTDPANTLRAIASIELPPGTWAVRTASQVDQPGAVRDPRTGGAATRARTVTAVARHGAAAGAWAAAFFVLGCDSALALAPRLGGIGVLCVDDRVRWTADLDGRVAVAMDSSGSAGTGPARARAPAPAGAAAPTGPRIRRASPDSSR